MQHDVMIDLQKRVEDVGIVLAKSGLQTIPPTRVGLCLDVSGSIQGLYRNHVMEQTVARCQAIAMKFDDNGELDVWAFSSAVAQFPGATEEHYGTYVKNVLLANEKSFFWEGTEYSQAMRAIDAFYFPDRPRNVLTKPLGLFNRLLHRGQPEAAVAAESAPSSALPAHVLFVTDGEDDADDLEHVVHILRQTQDLPVYWNMVGVGPAKQFTFLKELAADFGHVGFVNLSTLDISDEDLYAQILNPEFVQWVKRLTSAGSL